MKNIGVVACYNNYNYGSMLQAYATLAALDKLGYNSEFINYKKSYSVVEKLKFLPRFLNMYLMREKLRLLEKKLKIRKYPDIKKGDSVRKAAFRRFAQKYYEGRISKEYIGYKALQTSPESYDSVLVGSDQLWFPAGLPTNFYNLMFVSDEKNKIAYSTSFGVSDVPFYQKKRTRQFLNRLNHIAVREQSGKELIKKLTDRDVDVVLDPTLLLTKDEWAERIAPEQVLDGEYIFCYFLGSDERHRKVVTELSEKTGLPIYDMPHIDEFVKGDISFTENHLYDIDPSQFVNLIRHAKYVCTDSFHCCVFSIIHHKQFMAFDRYSDPLMASRNSRILNLCNITGLESRRFKNDILAEISSEPDFENADLKLRELQRKSFAYLKNSLD